MPYRYDLDPDEIVAVTRDLPPPVRRRDRFACMGIPPEERAWGDVARTLERTVFGREFGTSVEDMVREYAVYESASHFLLVVDRRTGMPAGVTRLVPAAGPYGPLKSVDDLGPAVGCTVEDYLRTTGRTDLTGVVDIATLAVAPDHRGSSSGSYLVSALMMRAIYLIASTGAGRDLVALLDRKVWRSLRFVGIPVTDALDRGSFPYFGSPASYAVGLSGPDMKPSCLGRRSELRRSVLTRIAGRRTGPGLLRALSGVYVIGLLHTGRRLDRCFGTDVVGLLASPRTSSPARRPTTADSGARVRSEARER